VDPARGRLTRASSLLASAAFKSSIGGAQMKPKLTAPSRLSTAWWIRCAWTMRLK
jgi:hypothetical protein